MLVHGNGNYKLVWYAGSDIIEVFEKNNSFDEPLEAIKALSNDRYDENTLRKILKESYNV